MGHAGSTMDRSGAQPGAGSDVEEGGTVTPRTAGPPASKTEYALRRLREEIASGTIRPGEAIRQSDLAKRYGISPTPVREALRLLESEGSVTYSPHRGATVTHHDEQRMADLYALRARSESLAAELCAERRTDEQLAELVALQERLRQLADQSEAGHIEFASWNRELHLRIATIGSEPIAGQLAPLWGMFPTRRTMWAKPDLVRCFLDDHDTIIAAIEARDARLAGATMHRHILSALDARRADPADYIRP
jgi:DNA-binding GntR family transcriptional regulator